MIRINLYNNNGQKATCSFPDTANATHLAAFFAVASKAGVRNATKIQPVTFTETDPQPNTSLDRMLVCNFRAVQTGVRARFSLPCPIAESVVTKRGRKLMEETKAMYLAAWIAVNGYANSWRITSDRFVEHR